MDKEEESCPQFSQIMMPHILEAGILEIPQRFLKEGGIYLSEYAFLEVKTGERWKVELTRRDGRVWLHKGWQEFVQSCSIKSGHSLVFRYQRGSIFHVFLFDTRHLEIQYPAKNVNKSQRVNLDQSKVPMINLEDSDDDIPAENLNEPPRISNHSRKRLSCSNAREIVIQRAKAFLSKNPRFISTIRPTHLTYLYVPGSDARTYFYGRNENSLHLIGPDGKSWAMEYRVLGSPLHQVRITTGWIAFVREYHLQDGDTCVFELIDSTLMAFNVIIFRLTDEEVEKEDQTSLESAESLQCNKPSFTVVIKFNIQSLYYLYTLRVPNAHASSYLSDQHEKDVFLHGVAGDIWPVNCTVHGLVVRFSLGWKDFVVDNDVQEGDACVFELLSQTPVRYNVTISRAAESGKPN